MYFIQSSWFIQHWIFLLLFLVGSLSIIAYINDKRKLLRYATVSFILLVAFYMYFLVLPQINHSLALNDNLLSTFNVDKSTEEKISIFSKVINFAIGILKNKPGE
jgi:asparagine N-glycosylation enzyme membrane subunit Stt3